MIFIQGNIVQVLGSIELKDCVKKIKKDGQYAELLNYQLHHKYLIVIYLYTKKNPKIIIIIYFMKK